MNGASVFIVEDHALMRLGYELLFQSVEGLQLIGEADSATEALRLIPIHQPDLVIVDINLKEGSGLDLVKQLHEQQPDLPVLILSMYDESLYAERALQAGAWGYVMKSQPSEVLIEAIHHVLGGKLYLSPDMAQIIFHRMQQPAAGAAQPLTPSTLLTDREFEIFLFIGQGLSTSQIARKLFISSKTVDVHRFRIRKKLALSSSAELARYAVQWVEKANR